KALFWLNRAGQIALHPVRLIIPAFLLFRTHAEARHTNSPHLYRAGHGFARMGPAPSGKRPARSGLRRQNRRQTGEETIPFATRRFARVSPQPDLRWLPRN